MNIKDLSLFYQGKKILITGAAGTVGKELVKQLLAFDVAELRLMDNNETELFFLQEEYKQQKKVIPFIGDIRDRVKLDALTKTIDIVFHCAALKHVILSEYNPFDAVQSNILGVENVIRASLASGVKYVILTSSDKAVNPTNVMGTTKLMGERLITAANAVKNNSKTVLSSTRFGNVIGSRGSVVPLFAKQIKNGGPITITDEEMTRFIMTIEESVGLVLRSVPLSKGGEVFVTKMPVIKIIDLARAMIELLAPRFGYKASEFEIEVIGSKPGEKLYEELMTEEEVPRSQELEDMFVVTPAFKNVYETVDYEYDQVISKNVSKSYVSASEPCLSLEEVKDYIQEHRLLEEFN